MGRVAAQHPESPHCPCRSQPGLLGALTSGGGKRTPQRVSHPGPEHLWALPPSEASETLPSELPFAAKKGMTSNFSSWALEIRGLSWPPQKEVAHFHTSQSPKCDLQNLNLLRGDRDVYLAPGTHCSSHLDLKDDHGDTPPHTHTHSSLPLRKVLSPQHAGSWLSGDPRYST